MRRHPDLPHAKDGSDFGALIELQSQLLDHAIGLLKPGGRLVYCTCSLLPDEGECQVEEALGRHQNLQIDQAAMNVDFIDPQMRSEEGGLRLTPDMLGSQVALMVLYRGLQKPNTVNFWTMTDANLLAIVPARGMRHKWHQQGIYHNDINGLCIDCRHVALVFTNPQRALCPNPNPDPLGALPRVGNWPLAISCWQDT